MRLRALINGAVLTQAIRVAALLGLADHLAEGPKTAADLAAAVGAHPGAVYRLLRALAAHGIFAEGPDGRFALTPLAEMLRSDVPGSVRRWAVHAGSPWRWRALGDLTYSVETGAPAFDRAFGMELYEYLSQHVEEAAAFDAAVAEATRSAAEGILACYDFFGAGLIVDVGGGDGTLLAAILAAYPDARGILFDLPRVADQAQQALAKAGLGDRCRVIPGNFFHQVPEDGDIYILKSVLHNWDDAQAVRLLQNCRSAMPAQGKLLIVEFILPPGDAPSSAKLLDLVMLVLQRGGERTEAQYRILARDAGLTPTRCLLMPSGMGILEAHPA